MRSDPSHTHTRQEALSRYFWAPPHLPALSSPALIGIVIVLLLLIFLLTEAAGGLAGGLLAVLALPLGIFCTFAVLAPEPTRRLVREALAPRDRPSDAAVEQWTRDSISRIVERSRNLLGLSADEVIALPAINTRQHAATDSKVLLPGLEERAGRDGVTRAPLLTVRVVWVTPRKLLAHECLLNLVEDSASGERTYEYPAAEVAGISIASAPGTTGRGPASADAVVLEIKLKSGGSERISLAPGALEQGSMADGPIPHLVRFALHQQSPGR